MDIPNRIATLIARSLTGESSPEDEQELAAYVATNPEVQQHVDTLKKLWQNKAPGSLHTPGLQSSDRQRIKRILAKAKEEGADLPVEDKLVASKAKVYPLWARYISYAAILFLVVTGGWFFLSRDQGSGTGVHGSNERVVIAQKGSRTRTLLPDGSIVWLNSGSKIRYRSDFQGAIREVYLSGEAFFDVVKQPNRPFIVHAGDIDVRVLGTAFNVKFYEGDQNIETTLLRGAIEVTSQKDKNSKILLKPNEKLIVSNSLHQAQEDSSAHHEAVVEKQEKEFQIIQFNTPAKEDKLLETAWMYNRLEFRDESFEELASKLERWYNVNIVFGDEAVKRFRLYGSFEKETIEEAMTALQKVHSFTYKINANEIYIQSSE